MPSVVSPLSSFAFFKPPPEVGEVPAQGESREERVRRLAHEALIVAEFYLPGQENSSILSFIRKNIQASIEETLEGRGSGTKLLLEEKRTVRLKSRIENGELRLYVRVPKLSGVVKDIEEQVVLLGHDRGAYAYAKPVKIHSGENTKSNRREMENEYQKAKLFSDCKNTLPIERVYNRGKVGRLKAVRSPWSDQGDLWGLLHSSSKETLSEDDKFQIAIDLAVGLEKIHGAGQVHLDIKVPNVLVFSHNGRLRAVYADFGRTSPEGRLFDEIKTTPAYTPPEVIVPSWRAGSKIDLWGLGLMFIELWLGTAKNLYSSPRRVKNEDFYDQGKFGKIRENWRAIHRLVCGFLYDNTGLNSLFKELISFDDPEKRPEASEVVRRLRQLHAQSRDMHANSAASGKKK